MLDENCMKHDGPMSDLDPSSASRAELMPSLNETMRRIREIMARITNGVNSII